ncbi:MULTISPECIES: Smr/MutS family protein [Legionella]|uniref:DNA mismatch repair protein-like protein n=1 Tax=Legionella maceachernii TaxID=466 RepID=A0A0W0VX87_9GAMM|nr:Smr/MutS family protein [Legionella maceachernii]KTD24510.1 DNA mismatch repair protein-like protein [Legionella maceachernii]SJZ61066.1 DNA-nicking endonuclease, Smr domain [Legionella maceachernii]SUP00885.1 Probable DNA endonuclease SmrA [Legionella maceachernii]
MSDDSLSEDDKALFRKMMGDVKPLKKSDKINLGSTGTKNRKQERIPVARTTTVYLSDYYAEEVQANTILFYSSHRIPNKRLRELKAGRIPWQAKLDLHGLRPDDAKEALIKFIGQQTDLARRSLLIIHGKGSHRGEAPVLKNLVNRWLTQFPQVLAFHSALARDGGEGALYVLLKRQKEETN